MSRGAINGCLLASLGFTSAATLLACAPATNGDGSQESGRAQGIGTSDKLSAAEWTQYVANQQYIHGLTKPDTRVRLNMADPKQYNFAISRLKLSGKTAANSPYLFERIEERRQKHVAQGLKPGTFAEPIKTQSDAQRSEKHRIEGASFGGGGSIGSASGGSSINATAGSTFPDGALYTWVDVNASTVSGYPISPFAYTEEFEPPVGRELGARVLANAEGALNVSNVKRYAISSFKYEDSEEEFTDSYTYKEVGKVQPMSTAAIPFIAGHYTVAPIDINADARISVCMDRLWTNDCDYLLHGTAQSVQVPLNGGVTLPHPFIFDRLKVLQIQDDMRNGRPTPYEGTMTLVLANAGGGCDVTDGNALNMKMIRFWNQISLSPDNQTFSWDLTGANAAFFDDGCRQVQDSAVLTTTIKVPVLDDTGSPSDVEFTVTSDAGFPRPEIMLAPITLTNSCLAEGTKVQLAHGKTVAVESLQIGQEVFNPYDREDNALTIMDTAIGVEPSPMVKITDEQGRTLMMTQMHPISTPDRGMVQARALKVGDLVMTKAGPSKLTEVSREAYSGKVYNVKLGTQAEMAKLIDDQTILYANGFVVGDGQIQSKYEKLNMSPAAKPLGEGVADQWRRDYRFSAQSK